MEQQAQDRARLFAKLAAVKGEIGAIAKDGRNTHFNYEYMSADGIKNHVRPLFAKHGLAFFPAIMDAETVSAPGQKNTLVRVTMQFTICCADTGATFAALWKAEGSDTGDKAINKAATAGTKYFLINLLLASTGEVDPDSESPEVARQAPPPACENCGTVFPPDAPQRTLDAIRKRHGKLLCKVCREPAEKES